MRNNTELWDILWWKMSSTWKNLLKEIFGRKNSINSWKHFYSTLKSHCIHRLVLYWKIRCHEHRFTHQSSSKMKKIDSKIFKLEFIDFLRTIDDVSMRLKLFRVNFLTLQDFSSFHLINLSIQLIRLKSWRLTIKIDVHSGKHSTYSTTNLNGTKSQEKSGVFS